MKHTAFFEAQTSADGIFAANAAGAIDPAAAGEREPHSWAEVHAWCEVHAPHLCPHIAKLSGKLDFGPLAELHLGTPDFGDFTTLREWTEHHFPRSKKGTLPKIAQGYGMTLGAYKTTRQKLLKALKDYTGETAARQERDTRPDGWADVLALFKPLSENKGPLPEAQFGVIAKGADFARLAGVSPWEMGDPPAAAAIESVLPTEVDRATVNRMIRILNEWADLLEFGGLLPPEPIVDLESRGSKLKLPEHVETFIETLVDGAAYETDPNTGKRHPRVGHSTIDRYRAALCHHVRMLPLCNADEALGYTCPVASLDTVNDVAALFDPDHVSATLRESEARDHLPGTPEAKTVRAYYKTLHLVLSRIDGPETPLDQRVFAPQVIEEIAFRIDKSRYLKIAASEYGMTKEHEAWCQMLVTDPHRERRFHNLHRIFQAKAKNVMAKATDSHGVFHADQLSASELTRAIQLGACAAATAIVITGRPLRLGNVLGLRHRGRRQTINRGKSWEFWIPAEEAKAGKEIPAAAPNPATNGPQVLDWYFRTIRPLLDPNGSSIHLFPAPTDPHRPLSKGTYRIWFQRAASDAGLPMTFHLFRHGWASILIKAGTPLEQIADMLGNTLAVCAEYYAFLDSDHVVEITQTTMAHRANALRDTRKPDIKTARIRP